MDIALFFAGSKSICRQCVTFHPNNLVHSRLHHWYTYYLGGPHIPFTGDNTISIESIVKVNRLMKDVAELWQYFINIICNILFVPWQYFVIIWQTTLCTVCHPAMACLRMV